MPRRGENIWKRKDGRWEARYIKGKSESGKALYGYVYARAYAEVKWKRQQIIAADMACQPLQKYQKATAPCAGGPTISDVAAEYLLHKANFTNASSSDVIF